MKAPRNLRGRRNLMAMKARQRTKKDEQADVDSKEESDKTFVPTATKQQFVTVEKAYNKAVGAYENGLNKLI